MTAAILDHLWQSSLVAILVCGLTVLLRNNSASVRYWLWYAASLKFLLPCSLLAALGRMAFTQPVAASSFLILSRIQPAAAPFSATPLSAAPTAVYSAWPSVLVAIWLLGLLMLVLSWLVRWRRLRAMALCARPLALDVPVPVRATSSLLEPGLVGIWRPVILLPEGIARHLSRTEIDAIVTHELCHLRRRDNLLAMAHMLVEAVFWFHPLVWFIGTRLVAEREHACDESVLACGKNPREYAQAILKVCRLYIRSPLVCASGVSGANLDIRIAAIMANRDIHDMDPGRKLLLAGLGVLTIMAPLVTGGLKSVPAARLAQGFANIVLPLKHTGPELVQPIDERAAAAPAYASNQHRQRKPASAIPPREEILIPPAIVVSAPAIVIAVPPVVGSPANAAVQPQPVASDANETVCRPPQPLPGSRFRGPQVCLPKHEWDRMKQQGVELMPDGRGLAMNYEKEHSLNPRTCTTLIAGASTAGNWIMTCSSGP